MELGMIGLGRMGASMTKRLLEAGHSVVAFDPNEAALARSASDGATVVNSLEAMVAKLSRPCAVWMMVPAGDAVDRTVERLSTLLKPDDILIDGGNSNYRDTIQRASSVQKSGV